MKLALGVWLLGCLVLAIGCSSYDAGGPPPNPGEKNDILETALLTPADLTGTWSWYFKPGAIAYPAGACGLDYPQHLRGAVAAAIMAGTVGEFDRSGSVVPGSLLMEQVLFFESGGTNGFLGQVQAACTKKGTPFTSVQLPDGTIALKSDAGNKSQEATPTCWTVIVPRYDAVYSADYCGQPSAISGPDDFARTMLAKLASIDGQLR